MSTSSNQLFSFRRWRLLVAKHWAEQGRRYLLSLLAIGGLIAAWEAFLVAIIPFSPLEPFMQFATYMVGLWLTGCLFGSMLFSDLSSQKQGLPWLSLPASHLEKLLSVLLYGVVLFWVAYTLVFYLVDIPMVEWANSILRHHPRNWPGTNQSIPQALTYNIIAANGAPVPERQIHLFSLGYFGVQSAFILGSVYFTRFAFVKTVVAILLFELTLMVFQKLAIQPLLPQGWSTNFLRWTQEFSEQASMPGQVRLPFELEGLFTRIVQFGLAPFFWVITWFRLKEKEV